jgi:hypothetical protein
MGRIKELILETQERGYDIEKLSIEEMLEIRDYGKLKCIVRDAETRSLTEEEEEWLQYEAEKAEYIQATQNFGPRLHFEF